MSVIQAIREASEQVVDLDGLQWRIRTVTSADVSAAGVSRLIAAPAFSPDAAKALDGAEGLERVRRAVVAMGPAALDAQERTALALACAGVRAVRQAPSEGDPDPIWEPIRLVMEEAQESESARPQLVWIGRLPVAVQRALGGAVEAHSLEEGRACQRLASFRGV